MAVRVIIATFMLVVSGWAVGPARADEAALPEALREHARTHGCREVEDFDARPGVSGSPFVFGYVPDSGQGSAAYWCETGPVERPGYRLMLVLADRRHELARCVDHVEWGDRIGGLSIEGPGTTTMDGFVPLDYRTRRPPKGTPLTHPAIRSRHESAAATFYCHEGVWFVRMGD